MTSRDTTIARFLSGSGWGDAAASALAGDASRRRYIRLVRGGSQAILMDAPPETGETTLPFIYMAERLRARDLSAPDILAQDTASGLLLLEDFGDALLSAVAAQHPEQEQVIYAAAGNTLAAMQALDPTGLEPYPPLMADLAATVVDWYAPEAQAHRAAIEAAMAEAISAMPAYAPVLVHRDYHADNLIWLPDRDGVRRIGLLDFQDAMSGPPEYDLASLIHDPRRLVSDQAAAAALRAWLDATGHDATQATHRIAVCSVQRGLRILGRVFSRLCLHGGRDSYLRFIPPTWAALQRELQHPALADLKTLLDPILPAPTDARLAALRAAKGRFQDRPHAEVYA